MKKNERALSLLLLLVMTAGAAAADKKQPETFATVDEVFPPSEVQNLADVPSEALERRTFPVAYADMFQIVNISASKALLDVRTTDAARGTLLITKSRTRYAGGGTFVHRIFGKIIVREVDPRQTEVILITKEQAECLKGFGGWCGGWIHIPTYRRTETGTAVVQEIVQDLFTTIRINLIDAGLL